MNIFELSSEQWVEVGISVGIVVFTLILGRWAIKLFLNRFVRSLIGKTNTMLDDIVLEASKAPIFWFVFISSLQIAVRRLDFLGDVFQERFEEVYFVLYLLAGFVLAGRLINAVSEWYTVEIAPKTDSDADEQVLPFIRRVALILLAALAVIMLLERFDVEVSGLVATLGITSLAVALAAQAALADTISGFLIMIDRPFRIGDRIELLDLNTWGDVVDIGLRSTRIRTRDNRMVIVPNSVIAKSLIVNHSFPDSQYRLQIELGIAYDSDIEQARRIMIETVRNVEGVLEEHPVEALFLQFGDSAMIFRVRWWLESYVDTRRMFDRVNSALFMALREAGIFIPYPTQVVHYKEDQGQPPFKRAG